MAILSWNTYIDKTLGCWMGKNAGGTLGGPVEGRREILDLNWYPKIQEGGIPNDDLEVQLVWLHALETRGLDVTAEDLSAYWLDHYLPNWDEYGFGKTNIRKGLLPPLSGAFNNPFSTSMGCPIRAEIWACIAPGIPLLAARLARTDAMVDHTDESIYAEMLFAVIESAAYLEHDRERLLDLGLAAIPETCRTARAVREMQRVWNRSHDWTRTRQAILDLVGDPANFTDAPQNIAFTLLGWYRAADDFGKAICAAVNCGFDTDCTGATLGAILGIVRGADRLPARWMEPLGNSIAIIEERTRLQHYPGTLQELTQRTAAVAVASLAHQGKRFGPDQTVDLQLPTPKELRRRIREAGLWDTPRNVVEHHFHHGSVRVLYPQGPVLAPDDQTDVRLSLTNRTERRLEGPVAAVALTPGLALREVVPDGIDLMPGESGDVEIRAELSAQASPRAHADIAVALQAEGIAPWSFVISFVRPMVWEIEKRGDALFETLGAAEPEVKGERIAVEGNAFPLPEKGLWLGRTRVLNPSAHGRDVRICTPSTIPVKVWLNGTLDVNNPGSERIRPSYHSNAACHYGQDTLRPGWNTITAAWLRRDPGGDSHFFLTDPGGRGWGDLVFEP